MQSLSSNFKWYDFGMDITMLFEQVIGLYLIISGALVITRQEHVVSVGRLFGKEPALRFSMSALMVLGGLFMVLSYRDWSTVATSIITLVGWLVLLKGLVFYFASDSSVQKMLNKFGKGHYYTAWGIIAVALGAYLALLGFGMMV